MTPEIAKIEWIERNDTAVMGCDPFFRNSYTARVEFADGYVVGIALPVGARRYSTETDWAERVVSEARDAYGKGDHECVMV